MTPVTDETSLTSAQETSWRLRARGFFSFLCVFIPLSVGVHINHFQFHSSPFPQYACQGCYNPCLPTFLSFIFHSSHFMPPPHYLCVILYFHFSLTVCNASYLLSPHLFHPPNAFSSTSTPRKISFSLSPDGNETFIHFWDAFPLRSPSNCPSKASAQALCTILRVP